MFAERLDKTAGTLSYLRPVFMANIFVDFGRNVGSVEGIGTIFTRPEIQYSSPVATS